MTRWLALTLLFAVPTLAEAEELGMHGPRVEVAAPQTAPVEVDTSSGGPKSPALIVAGLFMSAGGIGGLIAGGALLGGESGACSSLESAAAAASAGTPTAIPTDDDISACQAEVNRTVAGGIALVTGGAFVLAGLPLVIVGALPEEDVQVSFEVQPTGGSLRIAF